MESPESVPGFNADTWFVLCGWRGLWRAFHADHEPLQHGDMWFSRSGDDGVPIVSMMKAYPLLPRDADFEKSKFQTTKDG